MAGSEAERRHLERWHCRFLPANETTTTIRQVLELLDAIDGTGFNVIKTEHLYSFDGRQASFFGRALVRAVCGAL